MVSRRMFCPPYIRRQFGPDGKHYLLKIFIYLHHYVTLVLKQYFLRTAEEMSKRAVVVTGCHPLLYEKAGLQGRQLHYNVVLLPAIEIRCTTRLSTTCNVPRRHSGAGGLIRGVVVARQEETRNFLIPSTRSIHPSGSAVQAVLSTRNCG